MDIDMSRPGVELFPEEPNTNSYQGVKQEAPDAAEPMYTGVDQPDVAGQGQQMSDKELNFRALREEVSKIQAEREYWKGKAEAFQSNSTRPEPEPVREEYDPFKGVDGDDYVKANDVKRAILSMREENERLKREIGDQLAATTTKASRPDWENLVSQHVPQLTSKNPIFAEMIRNASNPYEAAYLLAELNAGRAPVQAPQPPPNPNGQRAISNAMKPQSVNGIGGQGSLSAADHYAQMSDEDFMKIAARNLAGI